MHLEPKRIARELGEAVDSGVYTAKIRFHVCYRSMVFNLAVLIAGIYILTYPLAVRLPSESPPGDYGPGAIFAPADRLKKTSTDSSPRE